MAATRYFPNSNLYPPVISAIIERLLLYICETLYPAEYKANISDTIFRRTFIADIQSGNDVLIGENVEYFKETNGVFPFTAYNIGDKELQTSMNTLLAAGYKVPVEGLGYASFVPCTLTVPMITFFNTAYDWNLAYSRLISDNASLTQLDVPIKINGEDNFFKIRVSYETLGKGSYAWAFEEYMRAGEIWDLQHDVKVEYYEMNFSGYPFDDQSGLVRSGGVIPTIGLVDDIVVSLSNLSLNREEQHILLNRPITVTCSVENNAINVPVNTSFVFTFSQSMRESSVLSQLSILPYFDYNYSWNATGTQLTITPQSNLKNNFNYIITIGRNALAVSGKPLMKDFTVSIRTVA